jgi:hypothetical protein
VNTTGAAARADEMRQRTSDAVLEELKRIGTFASAAAEGARV